MKNNHFSREITQFHKRIAPEPCYLVGYGAIIESLELPVPIPRQLAIISKKRRQYILDDWLVFTPRHKPKETLYDHLVFALKYEGVNLLFFKKLFEKIDSKIIEQWVLKEPTSQYCRKIWFLYEWLMDKLLSVPELTSGNYIPILNDELQYVNPVSINVRRQRIKNNLPGVVDFCPLIHKTKKLENYISEDYSKKTILLLSDISKDILLRSSSFLLLKDSKASFNIEGETPTKTRVIRWGNAIGQAGKNCLDKEELLRLQKIVIENSRFIKLGYRDEGGFVGEYDRNTGEPIPEHISAKWQDLESLMTGLLSASKNMSDNHFHPVLTAAKIAFGFVFIHPFVDGNGRLHRYLIHHFLSKMKFSPEGIIFPVSTSILDRIDSYREVLENYSHPLLEFIKWEKTYLNNIEVLNATIDYYRYFDATVQAEFLFECVIETINKIIPEEVIYIQNYDTLKNWLNYNFGMTDKMVALLVRFLEQNNGILSRRAKENEFAELEENEVKDIEKNYKMIFGK